MRTARGSRVRVKGGGREVGDKVIVESLALGYRRYKVAAVLAQSPCSDRAAHGLSITHAVGMIIYYEYTLGGGGFHIDSRLPAEVEKV